MADQLEATRTRFSNVLKRHAELVEHLSRDSQKIFQRLQKEFECARASQSEVILNSEEWNDGLLAMLREKVHIASERSPITRDVNTSSTQHAEEKIAYRIGSKVICCLERGRIGIQYETVFTGESCEFYYCVLESRSFLEKMLVSEHTVPFFLPLREAEDDLLSSNAVKFINYIGDLLQAYVDRREQVRLVKELYGDQIGELYHSLPYHMIEFVLDEVECSKIMVSLRYTELSVLPTEVEVLAWPTNLPAGHGELGNKHHPTCLHHAELTLQNMSLPEAYAQVVPNLPRAVRHIFEDNKLC